MAKAMARRTYFSPRRPAGPPHSVAPTLNNNHEGVGRASAMGIVEPGHIPESGVCIIDARRWRNCGSVRRVSRSTPYAVHREEEQ